MWYLRQGVSGINEEMIISVTIIANTNLSHQHIPCATYIAIIGVSEVVRISVSTNCPQKYFLQRVFAISLQMPRYCAYLQFRYKIQTLVTKSEPAKLLQILNLRQKKTKYATKKEQTFAIKRPKT